VKQQQQKETLEFNKETAGNANGGLDTERSLIDEVQNGVAAPE